MENSPPPLVTEALAKPRVHPARGWLLIVTGVGLSAGMAYLSYAMRDIIRHNDDPGARAHWHGDAAFTYHIFWLFRTIFVLGLTGIAAGIHILWTGRISRILAAVMILVGLWMAWYVYVIIQSGNPH